MIAAIYSAILFSIASLILMVAKNFGEFKALISPRRIAAVVVALVIALSSVAFSVVALSDFYFKLVIVVITVHIFIGVAAVFCCLSSGRLRFLNGHRQVVAYIICVAAIFSLSMLHFTKFDYFIKIYSRNNERFALTAPGELVGVSYGVNITNKASFPIKVSIRWVTGERSVNSDLGSLAENMKYFPATSRTGGGVAEISPGGNATINIINDMAMMLNFKAPVLADNFEISNNCPVRRSGSPGQLWEMFAERKDQKTGQVPTAKIFSAEIGRSWRASVLIEGAGRSENILIYGRFDSSPSPEFVSGRWVAYPLLEESVSMLGSALGSLGEVRDIETYAVDVGEKVSLGKFYTQVREVRPVFKDGKHGLPAHLVTTTLRQLASANGSFVYEVGCP